ncbi:MAG: hypothetical protein H6Q74_2574 [Firmicutes bacterium]|nr:hypothetical protein [Bacillota bacterium]
MAAELCCHRSLQTEIQRQGGQLRMKYELFDWEGIIPWLVRPDETFLVDPDYLQEFLAVMESMEEQ